MKYYGATAEKISSREKQNAALARRAASESFVLLKNSGVLPLLKTTKKVALYGMGARKTVAGGEGSGNVTPRYKVSIEQGLENAGITITSKAWLDDYDAEYVRTYEEYRQMVEEKIAHIQNPVQQIPEAHKYKYRYPSGRLIDEKDVAFSDTDTALYVLMRQAGECADRKNEPGDFQLTEIEEANLRFLADRYPHTILIVNVGGLLDLSILDSVSLGAVVYYAQGGMEGGNALADVLTGKKNFCGKLADTWPRGYRDIPGGENFSSLNGNLEQEFYEEGVYVGYRYFDSFAVAPRWPFGFGLSYTDFTLDAQRVSLEGTTVHVSVKVANIGQCAGREVAQAYLSVPGSVYQTLAAFGKTAVLQPGTSETLTLSFALTDNAVYDEAAAAWKLPAGEYPLAVGNSSRAAHIAAVLCVDTDVTVRQCRNCCAPQVRLEGWNRQNALTRSAPAHTTRLKVATQTLHTAHTVYAVPNPKESNRVAAILDSLPAEEQIELVRGGDLQANTPGQHQIMGAGGKTCITLLEKGIPNILFSDGPAGVNIMAESVYEPDGCQKAACIPEVYNWGLMRKFGSRMVGTQGVHVYRYATAWPVEALLAQSWDTALLQQIGEAIAQELVEFGITLWLAPGMNIHRNPLCGRNFEYYSEDPLLTGKMAAALTRGVQKQPGVGTVIKHFCCNNQEDNRFAVDAVVSEKALREIYLRGFEIAVREASPLAVMTSYNKVNGTYSGNRADLVCAILRCEWGYDGLVMTDWGTGYDAMTSVNVGTDLTMPGSTADRDALRAALAKGTLDIAALRRSAARVLAVIEQSLTAQL